MHQPPSETSTEASARSAVDPTTARSAELQWLALSPQRSKELAAELHQFTAAIAAVQTRLRFDGEPADWNVANTRWQWSRDE